MLGLLAAGIGLLLLSRKPPSPLGDSMHGTIPVPGTPTTDEDVAARLRVIEYASSQIGTTDPRPYWLDAYGFIPSPLGNYAWCGVFALWALRQARLTSRRWVAGLGFIYVDANGKASKTPWLRQLAPSEVPAMGDIAYYDQPFQHYALVEEVSGDRVHVIAGNTPNVSRSQPLLSKATSYFSIASILPSARS
jgi:hypothetical protein